MSDKDSDIGKRIKNGIIPIFLIYVEGAKMIIYGRLQHKIGLQRST